MVYDENQKKVLNLLLNLYENSKTYLGENKIMQSFNILPGKVFEGYDSDFSDVNLIRDFEHQMRELEKNDLIFIKWGRGVIEKLTANPQKWQDYYKILERQDKRTRQRRQLELYQKYLKEDPLLEWFCREQIDRLVANKKASYDIQEAENILNICKFILKNQEDILERELSVVLLGDSKIFREKYRSKVCNLLRKYGDFDQILLGIFDGQDKEDKGEMERILLAEHHVYSNPTYVYFKGNAEFFFDNGEKIKTNLHMPMAFSTETLKCLKKYRYKIRT